MKILRNKNESKVSQCMTSACLHVPELPPPQALTRLAHLVVYIDQWSQRSQGAINLKPVFATLRSQYGTRVLAVSMTRGFLDVWGFFRQVSSGGSS